MTETLIDIDVSAEVEALIGLVSALDVRGAQAAAQSVDTVVSSARMLAPRGPSSLLAESINEVPAVGLLSDGDLSGGADTALAGKVGGTSYASFVEFGTAPHDIKPRFRRALRFPVPGPGGYAFAKRVRHPGTQPQPFMQPALEQSEAAIIDAFEGAADNAILDAGLS